MDASDDLHNASKTGVTGVSRVLLGEAAQTYSLPRIAVQDGKDAMLLEK